jgi:N-glycosylase/DNA lyase
MHQNTSIRNCDPYSRFDDACRTVVDTAPAAEEEVVRGVRWGSPDRLCSPAFWRSVAHYSEGSEPEFGHRDRPLAHTVAFCLLGGFGVKAEVNEAAFRRLLETGILDVGRAASPEMIETCLSTPLRVKGRWVRYRFPRQRGKRLANALAMLGADPPPVDDVQAFRRHLMKMPGIGPKTASWIARDWLGSDKVAILDTHVVRACQFMKVFPRKVRLPQDYDRLEHRFLEFAKALGVRPSVLDFVIWAEMRELPRLGRFLR